MDGVIGAGEVMWNGGWRALSVQKFNDVPRQFDGVALLSSRYSGPCLILVPFLIPHTSSHVLLYQDNRSCCIAPQKMDDVEHFVLKPTPFVPNSPLPVVIYRNVLPHPRTEETVTEFLTRHNAWQKGVLIW